MHRWFDTHAHLDDPGLEPGWEARMAALANMGPRAWVVPGVRGEPSRLPGPLPGGTWIGRAIGLHPWYPASPTDLDTMARSLERHQRVAVGECGLDRGHRHPGDVDVLARQCELARDHDLPVILHVVHAHGQVLEILDRIRPPAGVVHAFTGAPDLAREYVRRGYKLGVGRQILRSPRLADTVRAVGLDHLVLESDAPVRDATAPLMGLDLEPVASAVARLCDRDLETVAARTWDNACRLYRLPPSFLETSRP
ncbi:MAG: TatD family hydrolase [bacterium]|nr:TatD family hydrolase [bacterium]